MSKSKIEWTDRVWNPVTGCTKVSPGCANCYAERMAKRLKGRFGYPMDDPFTPTVHWDRFAEPFTWKKPSKVFLPSMGDLFHEGIEDHVVHNIMRVVEQLTQHIFIILTKRPDRMLKFFNSTNHQFPNLPNVWLGVSAENQQTADERIPILLQIPAAVRFVSCEPLLDPVDLKLPTANCQLPTLNWVICGGESGSGARPMHPDWARSLRDQCQAANVPFFFKQWGEWKIINEFEFYYYEPELEKNQIKSGHHIYQKIGKKAAGRLLDGREYNEFPNLTTQY